MKNIQIYLNGEFKSQKELNLDLTLNQIRNILEEIEKDFIFLNKGNEEIEKEEEEDYKLRMIINKKTNQLFIKNSLINNRKTIKPIEGSKFLYTKKNNNEDVENDSSNSNDQLEIYEYPKIEFTEKEQKNAYIFLVIGETGSGKTTLINSFVNAVMGIQIDTDFRYVLVKEENISQAHSQTQDVNIYNIKAKDGTFFQIVDTPGYNDTKGMPQDKKITQKIFYVFNEYLHSITSICFVVKTTSFRLSPTQKYIFHSILDIFGEDVKENFIAMLTFCDGGDPLVIKTLKDPDSIYSRIIPHVKHPWYYKFNNSAFFSLNRKDQFIGMFWDLGMKSFINFIDRLKQLPKKSLKQTLEVGKERNKLEELCVILNQKLRLCLDKIEECKIEYNIIDNLKKDIKDSQNYEVEVTVPYFENIKLKEGLHTTTCLECNRTCHENCNIKDDDYKYNCWAMDENKNCRICLNKCKWNLHKNTNYIIKIRYRKEKKPLEELKKKYDNSKSKILNKKALLEKIEEKIINLGAECLETQELIKKAINRLKQIALIKDVLSDEEHINNLIENEKNEHTEGFRERIHYYQLLKEQKKLLVNTYHGNIPELGIIKEFLKEKYLNKDINIKYYINNGVNCCNIF